MIELTKIELNSGFTAALELMEHSRRNLFITGRAGTGKSTLLEYFRLHTKKNIAVLAPTGVAAVNVRGQTIHSFFKWKPDITVSGVKRAKEVRLYKKLDAIVIDEISMVRADLMDCIDRAMRLNGPDKKMPFGGVQLIMIGDLYQLPPVVRGDESIIFSTFYKSPYFFSAQAFKQQDLKLDGTYYDLEFLELEKVYRQKDSHFISLLNSIRDNTAGDNEITKLNSRLEPAFSLKPDAFVMYLTTKNDMAAEINRAALATLSGKSYVYSGHRTGKFNDKYLPTEYDLSIKIGAQVMMLNNDTDGKWVNGTVGRIVSVQRDEDIGEDVVMIKLRDGETVAVSKHKWQIYEFRYDAHSDGVESDPVGSFTQYPFRLAWAVTIHKSQGKTFDRVAIDIGNGTFSPGQLYVALSRCTSFEGIILKRPIAKRHIMTDTHVVEFVNSCKRQTITCFSDTAVLQEA